MSRNQQKIPVISKKKKKNDVATLRSSVHPLSQSKGKSEVTLRSTDNPQSEYTGSSGDSEKRTKIENIHHPARSWIPVGDCRQGRI